MHFYQENLLHATPFVWVPPTNPPNIPLITIAISSTLLFFTANNKSELNLTDAIIPIRKYFSCIVSAYYAFAFVVYLRSSQAGKQDARSWTQFKAFIIQPWHFYSNGTLLISSCLYVHSKQQQQLTGNQRKARSQLLPLLWPWWLNHAFGCPWFRRRRLERRCTASVVRDGNVVIIIVWVGDDIF